MALTNSAIVPAALAGKAAHTQSGNFSTLTKPIAYPVAYSGRLPQVWRDVYQSQVLQGEITQTIYSYSTPIAWHHKTLGWIIPDERYSPTTSSKHQTHLWRLGASRIILGPDATDDEITRSLSGEQVFRRTTRGDIRRTAPAKVS